MKSTLGIKSNSFSYPKLMTNAEETFIALVNNSLKGMVIWSKYEKEVGEIFNAKENYLYDYDGTKTVTLSNN